MSSIATAASTFVKASISSGQIPDFRFDARALADLAAELAPEFQHNEPYPHIVIPNFLPKEIANRLAEEFPGPDDIDWFLEGPGPAMHSMDKNVEKLSCSREQQFPSLTRHVMHEFNSGTFLDFLSTLTGFRALSPDPSFGGCGLHSTGRGGRLMIHADRSRHPNPKFHQLLNLIYYITPDWKEEWGGHLELWNKDASACVRKVAPEFNSALIFFTGLKSYHGHPHPVMSPPGIRRNSLAAYFYTTDRPKDETYDGYRDMVSWIPTNALDDRVSLFGRGRRVLETVLPAEIAEKIVTTVRKARRAK